MRGLAAAGTAASLVLVVAAAALSTSVGVEGALFGVGGGDAGSDALVAAASSDEAYQVSTTTILRVDGQAATVKSRCAHCLQARGMPNRLVTRAAATASPKRASGPVPAALCQHSARDWGGADGIAPQRLHAAASQCDMAFPNWSSEDVVAAELSRREGLALLPAAPGVHRAADDDSWGCSGTLWQAAASCPSLQAPGVTTLSLTAGVGRG